MKHTSSLTLLIREKKHTSFYVSVIDVYERHFISCNIISENVVEMTCATVLCAPNLVSTECEPNYNAILTNMRHSRCVFESRVEVHLKTIFSIETMANVYHCNNTPACVHSFDGKMAYQPSSMLIRLVWTYFGEKLNTNNLYLVD